MEWYDVASDVLDNAVDRDGALFTVVSLAIPPSYWTPCTAKQMVSA